MIKSRECFVEVYIDNQCLIIFLYILSHLLAVKAWRMTVRSFVNTAAAFLYSTKVFFSQRLLLPHLIKIQAYF